MPYFIMTDKRNNLIWVDLEMTGLNPLENKIIEIASIITDSELNILAEGPVIAIHQPDSIIDHMDAWNMAHHGASGLIDRVKASTYSAAQAEKETLAFYQQYVEPNTSPICGNTIGQDRRFLAQQMPTLEQFFHYRNIDVSTIKELVKRWYPEKEFIKNTAHQALSDIQDSIDELRYYRKEIFIQP